MINKKRKTIIFYIFLVIVWCFVIYSNSLNGGFIWDDQSLIRDNAYVKDWSKSGYFFTQNIGMGANRQGPLYRPLQMISYKIDFSLWGLNVTGYHLSNIIWHILMVLSVFYLLNLLFGDILLSFLTSVLFLSHPVHTEAVAYISGRADLLCGVFLLASVILYIKQVVSRKKIRYIFILFFYLLALLSKEYSLILPLLLLAYSAVFKEKLLIREFLSVLFMALIYIILRSTVLKFALPAEIYIAPLGQRLPGFFVSIYEYLRLLLFPYGLHMEYGRKLFAFSDPKALLGMVIVAVLLSYMVFKGGSNKSGRDNKIRGFSIAWFFLTLLPVANLYPVNAYMAEHWLYLPSIGFCLILADSLILLRRRMKLFGLFLIAAVLFLNSYLTVKQNIYWRDEISFYKRTLAYNPDSDRLYINLGNSYNEAGDYSQAIELYKKGIELNPGDPDAYYNLGNAYIMERKIEEAVNAYAKAISIAHGNIHLNAYYNNLAVAYTLDGRIEEAIVMYEELLQRDPENLTARNNLGILYGSRNEKSPSFTVKQ